MKFLCNHCKAKYQIADEKVQGRTLRMVCRQCGKEIIIQGPRSGDSHAPRRSGSSQNVPIPSSVLASDFRKQISTGRERPVSPVAIAQWHVAINEVPVGPMRLDEVSRKIATGAVGPDSLVWREGLDDWQPAAQVPEIAALLAAVQMSDSVRASAYNEHTHAAPTLADSNRPASRLSAMPIGGRQGADVPMSADELMASPAVAEGVSEALPVASIGRMREPEPSTRNLFQSWGVMFVMVCGGAFIMMIGVVLGVKYLGATERLERVTTTVEKAAPAQTRDESGAVIVLETQEIDGQLTGTKGIQKSGAKTKVLAVADNKTATTKNGKTLSAQEKDILDKMGGGLDRGLSGLRTASSNSASSNSSNQATPGGLKAAQLAAVVSRGKLELQRCYESALRLNPSNETIRLDVDITVGLSGSVTAIKTRGKALGEMDTCIARTVRMWRFPNATEETRTTFPVVFQPGA
jgi:hypothetical protein